MTSAMSLPTAVMIASIVVTATAGDVLTASAMRSIGDLDYIRVQSGMKGAILAVIGSPRFLAGVLCMAVSFFALLFALNHADLSLIAPGISVAHFREQRLRGEAVPEGKCGSPPRSRRRLRLHRRRAIGPLSPLIRRRESASSRYVCRPSQAG